MSALSNETSFHYQCAEATLPFSAVAQRLKTVISLTVHKSIYRHMHLWLEIDLG